MKKANKVEFFYLPKFYSEQSGGVMSVVLQVGDDRVPDLSKLEGFMDGSVIVIRPANKKELRKADQMLLELLKKS